MSTVTYLVRSGDTLTSIAQRYHTTVESLVRTNNLREPDRLRIGQLLRVQTTAPSAPQKTTPPTSIQKGKGLLVKKLKIVGPPQKDDTRAVACCGWAAFQVELYAPPATAEDKKRTRWLITDGATKAPLNNPDEVHSDLLLIDPIPEHWENKTIDVHAYCQAPSKDVKVSLTIKTHGEVGSFIRLVRMVEVSHPDWSGERILNSLRRLAGYDDKNFRAMYGGLAPADVLKPAGALTQQDLDALKKMTLHTSKGAVEFGIANDSLGESVALGHVLTGISAGQHRNKNLDLTPEWSLGAGELMDNLYATTIAGDLGQMAVFAHHRKAKNYIGPGTDATDAELVGDIDGFLIGSNIGRYTQGRSLSKTGEGSAKLSELLHEYYCVSKRSGAPSNTAADRFTRFSLQSRTTLQDQTQRFAANYAYASEGKWSGMWSGADGEDAKKAVDEFWNWLNKKQKQEALRQSPDMRSGTHAR